MRPLACILSLACALAVASSAAAEPTKQEKDTAAQLVYLGDEKHKAGEHEEALKLYQDADAIMNVPTTGIEVGRALAVLGRLREARDKLRNVADTKVSEQDPAAFRKAREAAKALLQELDERIPTVRVKVTGAAPDTSFTLRIDGAAVEDATAPQPLDPGEHTLAVEAPGHEPSERTVKLAEQQRLSVEMALNPMEGAGISPWVWVGFGVGGAGIVAGAITGGLALSAASDLKEQCLDGVCPTAARTDADRSNLMANISNVSFAVGAVGAAVGTVFVILSLSEPDDTQAASLRARVGPGSFHIEGTF